MTRANAVCLRLCDLQLTQTSIDYPIFTAVYYGRAYLFASGQTDRMPVLDSGKDFLAFEMLGNGGVNVAGMSHVTKIRILCSCVSIQPANLTNKKRKP